MPKDVAYGKTIRKTFIKTDEILEIPNLLEIQKESYNWFVREGLRAVFKDVAAITDHTGNLELTFIDFTMDEAPKYSVEECKARDVTYAARIKVLVRLFNRETDEIKEQDLYMGDFPIMTEAGTFIINGAERVVVSQIIRSPSSYFEKRTDPKTASSVYAATLIPYRGDWLEYETDVSDQFFVRIDKNRKFPITWLIRAFGNPREDAPYSWLSVPGAEGGVITAAQIKAVFGEDDRIVATLDKDAFETRDDSLKEIMKKIKPDEPPSVESAETFIYNAFFDPRRYDISKVGRYKFNKKLALWSRIEGKTLAEPVADPLTGEIAAEAGETLTRARAKELDSLGVIRVLVSVEGRERPVPVFSNGMVKIDRFIDFDPKELGIKERVRLIVLRKLLAEYSGDELKQAISEHIDDLIPKTVIPDDVFSTINYLNGLASNIGTDDDIDHLGNRRMRCVGELLQNTFRTGFSRMERVIRERMTLQDLDIITPQSLINIKPVTAAIKEFVGSSPLSQFMDQTNPLAELTHKRRMSALGPGGLSRERANFDVRDVHYTHYGRLCPIETPEGPNIGLISSLCVYAKINDLGFIETPYRQVSQAKVNLSPEGITYLT
ncbi:MAG: DNA-directed RNA polymerase subunit beta, partial [Oscillospiraceae bacterium]|nr:DNA-directed RNA polymerase subunit beta [Oscillospiraceae bacterium]